MISSIRQTKTKNRIKVPEQKQDVEKLIAEHRPKLKSFIRGKVAGREDAEDILQDVFYQFLKTVNIASNPVGQVSAWLYRVARNMIINHGKKMREDRLPVYRNDEGDSEIIQDFSEILFNDDISPSPETEYLRSLVWETLENALAELPPEQREIYELTEFDGIQIKEIAQTKGVAVNTLLSRKHYAVLLLRKRMRQLYEDIVFS